MTKDAVSALNVSTGHYLSASGSYLPVTNWFDSDGDEFGPEDAITCVAGRAEWFALAIADFSEDAQ